jgi:hypothetical protein
MQHFSYQNLKPSYTQNEVHNCNHWWNQGLERLLYVNRYGFNIPFLIHKAHLG